MPAIQVSAHDLGAWVRRQLADPGADTVHITRVIIQELSRAIPNGPNDAASGMDLSEPPDTGSREWDAFIEGAVAHVMHARGMKAPSRTRRTSLDENWTPNDLYSPAWHAINALTTPVELLDKRIVFTRENFARL